MDSNHRHVVKTGPVMAEAVFLDREEMAIYPLYRDPVHDFGFMRFDPNAIEFMKLQEIPLRPQSAQVGLEVKVIGNDSGEKISILGGTLARLDRDAPCYGSGYSDFNTFYFQAASGTKGGSSGSPVVDIHGHAVALNAGAKNKSASAFFLPLDRVVRALEIVQESCRLPRDSTRLFWSHPTIPRGDIQVTWNYKGFEEVRRLGLSHECERMVRRAVTTLPGTGMLVVEVVVPGGPAWEVLYPGDVLVKVNGKIIAHFLDLESLLDELVGEEIHLELERGGEVVHCSLVVEDLHAITPSRFVEFGGGTIQPLPYQVARVQQLTCGQVYVAEPGYMLQRAGLPRHSILTTVAGCSVRSLEQFIDVLSSLSHGEHVPLQFYTFSDRHRRYTIILRVDRKWYGEPKLWTRNDLAGVWSCEECGVCKASKPSRLEACTPGPYNSTSASLPTKPKDLPAHLLSSLALISFNMPTVAMVDGVHSESFKGSGLVVFQSEELGLLLTDRNTVPTASGDLLISFGAHPAEVMGKVRFLHPTHNFAICSYDPRELNETARNAVHPAEVCLGPPLQRGDSIQLVGMSKSMRPTGRVSTITCAAEPIVINIPDVPRYRSVHEEVIKVDHDFGSTFAGVLADDCGRVRALWANFARQVSGREKEFCAGIPSSVFKPWVEYYRRCCTRDFIEPTVVVLDATLVPILLSRASTLGLPEEWIERMVRKDPERRQVLKVAMCVAGSHAATVLKEADMILEINGTLVTTFADTYTALEEERLPSQDGEDGGPGAIAMTIFREGELLQVTVHPGLETSLGTLHLVHWAGALIQPTPRAVKELGFLPSGGGVYVSRWQYGSPSHRYGIYALHWITHINDSPTPDLTSFKRMVQDFVHGSFVRLSLVDLQGKTKVISLKVDHIYWPTWELALDASTGEWTRTMLQNKL